MPTREFSFFAVDAAADVWEQLPDRTDGILSKFDLFCERFGLQQDIRFREKIDILNGIVARAISGKFTLVEGLSLGGFDADRAACQYAQKTYQHQAAS